MEYIEKIKELYFYTYMQWILSIMVALRPQFLGLKVTVKNGQSFKILKGCRYFFKRPKTSLAA